MLMTKLDFDARLAAAELPPAPRVLTINEEVIAYMAHWDSSSTETCLASAIHFVVSEKVPDEAAPGTFIEQIHNVVVAYMVRDSSPMMAIWCGDKFLTGDVPRSSALERCAEAAKPYANGTALAASMMDRYGAAEQPAACVFWKEVARRTGNLCDHTNAVLATLRQSGRDFQQELGDHFQAAATLTHVGAGATSDIYELPDLAFRVPVLFEGERGGGKTYVARAFSKLGGHALLTVSGHESLESTDLLGHPMMVSSMETVWKDGRLSQAFRRAQSEKVVLLIDELLRIPVRQLSVLLTALSPDEGHYVLGTGRMVEVIDGIGQEEELRCPVANLCVIATTNVGSEYAVDEIDPALAERFHLIEFLSTEAQLREILKTWASVKGFGTRWVNAVVKFWLAMRAAQKAGTLARAPTTRTLVRAVELATVEDDIKRGLRSQYLQWAGRDAEGKPLQAQVANINTILEIAFK
jgi:MoxR-like ATPase